MKKILKCIFVSKGNSLKCAICEKVENNIIYDN